MNVKRTATSFLTKDGGGRRRRKKWWHFSLIKLFGTTCTQSRLPGCGMCEVLQLHEDSWRHEGICCVWTLFLGRGSVSFLRPSSKTFPPPPFKNKAFKETYSPLRGDRHVPIQPWSELHGMRCKQTGNVYAALRVEF